MQTSTSSSGTQFGGRIPAPIPAALGACVGGGAAPKLAIASWKLPELELFIAAGAYPAPLEKGPRLRGGDCDADAEEGGGAPKASFDGGSSKGEASNIFFFFGDLFLKFVVCVGTPVNPFSGNSCGRSRVVVALFAS